MKIGAKPQEASFGRLIEIRNEFDRSLDSLRDSHRRVERAGSYLSSPACHAGLARACMDRAVARRRLVIYLLREVLDNS
jgi:hypothetical protein